MVVGLLNHSLIFGVGGKVDAKKPVENIAKSKIVKVTVYPNSALITREVDIPDGEGVTEVTVSSLPIRTIDSSLYSEGEDGVRILSTRFRTRQVKEDTREDVRKIKDEIKKLNMETQQVQSEMQNVQKNMETISKMENFTSVTTVSSTKEGGLKSEEVLSLVKFVMEQRIEKGKKLVELQQKLSTIQEQENFLQRKLQEVSAGSSKTERDAVIVVDRVMGKGGKVRLNYLVDAVSWRPQYKLRTGKKDDPVEVDYLAALFQQSGEDWNGVTLTLSTAQPMINAVPPDLNALEVTVVARNTVGMPPVTQFGAQAPSFNPNNTQKSYSEKAKMLRKQAETYSQNLDLENNFRTLNEAAASEQAYELMTTRDELRAQLKQVAKVSAYQDGPSVTYRLPLKLSVPSRNDEQVVEITKLNLTPDFYYKTVPVINPNVYRLANLTNKSDYVLLPGEATMYETSDFVGRMRMPLVAIGEKFTVGFGVDPQLQVQRTLLDKTKGTQGGNQVLTYDYRILVTSYKKEQVPMQVWDRLPHGQNELIGVSLDKTSPELSEDPLYIREQKDENLLRWDLKVEPNMQGTKALEIRYSFRMELAREMVINELKSR